MPGRKAKTNKFLLLFSLVLCLVCGGTFRQSSATPSPLDEMKEPDIIVTGDKGASETLTTGDTNVEIDSQTPEAEVTATPTPEPTSIPLSVQTPACAEASPEASIGVWTPNGSKWMFMVNGAAYTGWLTDTDGKRYYLGSDGVMQTGWLELDNHRYYLDLDGILQIGDVTIDGQVHHFAEDGQLVSEETSKPAAESENVPEPTAEPAPSPEATPVPEPTATPEVIETPEPIAVPASDEDNTGEPSDPDEPTVTPEPTATPTPEPTVAPVIDKEIAITFNDGPSDYTGQILDILAETDSKATFFMQGSHVEGRSEILSRMQELGHELGNHAYTHFDLSELNYQDSSAEVAGVDELISSYIGVTTTVMRPPYGNMNSELADNIRKPVILWSVDSQDSTLTDAQQITDSVLAGASDGAIVLMHDTSEVTVQALKLLIPALQKAGYRLVTVSELAAAQGIELISGTTYSSLNN